MKGDFSRFTHDPARSYHGVLAQQGRVQFDADTNESVAIDAYLDRAALIDVMGRCFVSRATPGAFAIDVTKGSLTIGVGRIWVDGLLAECFGTGPRAIDPLLDTVRGADPVPYDAQPFLPDPPPLPGPPYLVYLDVWQRSVTAAEDPSLADPALGGPDTAARIQTVWQVRAVPGDALPPSDPPSGTLTTGGGYRGAENHLYRVEIHDPGVLGEATFTWSRDNGATAAAIVAGDRGAVRPARALDIRPGDLVELLDDRDELTARPGFLCRVKHVAEEILLADPPDAAWLDGALRPRVRRWDGHAPTGATELEDGISVSFGDGTYRTGDWWTFPARTAGASIEPLDAAPPSGIHHHTCPLALVTGSGLAEDRRPGTRDREGCPPDGRQAD